MYLSMDLGIYPSDVFQAGITMFLKELEQDRYRVCSGAFTEVPAIFLHDIYIMHKPKTFIKCYVFLLTSISFVFQGELIVDLNNENIRSLLIEKFEGSIIYR